MVGELDDRREETGEWGMCGYCGEPQVVKMLVGDRMQVRLYKAAGAVARKRGVHLDELVGQMLDEGINTLGITGLQVSVQLLGTYERLVFAAIVMEGMLNEKGAGVDLLRSMTERLEGELDGN